MGARRVLWASLVEVGEVNAHALLPSFLGDDDGIHQPLRVSYLPHDPCCLQLAGFLDDEGLLLGGLTTCLLLHWSHVWAYLQLVLDYSP